eukprot:1157445-Pelagomonas_calceolata.AAC.5
MGTCRAHGTLAFRSCRHTCTQMRAHTQARATSQRQFAQTKHGVVELRANGYTCAQIRTHTGMRNTPRWSAQTKSSVLKFRATRQPHTPTHTHTQFQTLCPDLAPFCRTLYHIPSFPCPSLWMQSMSNKQGWAETAWMSRTQLLQSSKIDVVHVLTV